MKAWIYSAALLVASVAFGPRGDAQKDTAVKRQSPFACDRLALDAAARKRHFDVLGPALAVVRKNVRELADGYEFEFPADRATVKQVLEFADGERLCCPFFDIDVRMEREGGSVWLRLTGREGTKQFIESDFKRWMHT